MRKLNLGSPLRVALISPAKAAPGLARTHGTGRQAKKHGAITRRPPVAALANPQLPAYTRDLRFACYLKRAQRARNSFRRPTSERSPPPLPLPTRLHQNWPPAAPFSTAGPWPPKLVQGTCVRRPEKGATRTYRQRSEVEKCHQLSIPRSCCI